MMCVSGTGYNGLWLAKTDVADFDNLLFGNEIELFRAYNVTCTQRIISHSLQYLNP